MSLVQSGVSVLDPLARASPEYDASNDAAEHEFGSVYQDTTGDSDFLEWAD